MTGAVLTFGELLLRLSPPGDERFLQSARLQTSVGGCEANVAVGLAQLGVPSRYVSRVPDNPIAAAAIRAVRAEGVDVSHMLSGDGRLGLYYLERGAGIRALRTVYDRTHSAFAGISPEQLDLDAIFTDVAWVHSSGIVAALGEGPTASLHAVLQHARAEGIRTCLDCNLRASLWKGRDPRPTMTALMPHVDLLIGNPGAFAEMLGETTRGIPPEPPDALADTARRIHARWGMPWIAITQREVRDASTHHWQAWVWEGATDTLHPGGAYTVHVVDRVGGGDAFAAGLLAAIYRANSLPFAARFATAAGAHKLTVPGDFARMSWAEIVAMAGLE